VETVKRLKPALPDTQFLMLTVYEDANHIYNALTAGATGYLLKQTSRDELLTAVRDADQGGRLLPATLLAKSSSTSGKINLPSRRALFFLPANARCSNW